MFAPASAHAALTVVSGGEARTVEVAGAAGAHTAQLSLLVRNESAHPVTPSARFLLAGGSPPVGIKLGAQPLRAGQIDQVLVTFELGTSTQFTGTLILGAVHERASEEVVVPVASSVPPPSAPAVEPEEVTLQVTHGCPGLLGSFICASKSKIVVWVRASAFAAGSERRRIAASGGGVATITLAPATAGEGGSTPPPKAGLERVVVRASADSHGSYSTSFVLDEAAKRDGTLKVNVNVQVWWLWPLLVLLTGAVLGYLTRWLMGTYRGRRILSAMLAEARDRYEGQIQQQCSPGLYPLRQWFGAPDAGVPQIPRRREYERDDLSGFAKLWSQVALARSAEDVEQLKPEVEKLSSDVAIWSEVDAALKVLDETFRHVVPNPNDRAKNVKIYTDTIALTERGIIAQPKTVEEAASLVAALLGQGEVIQAYDQTRAAWANVDPDAQDAAKEWNPESIYVATPEPLARTPEQAAELKGALIEAATRLDEHTGHAPKRESAVEGQIARLSSREALANIGPVAVDRMIRQQVGVSVRSQRNPHAIRRGIATIDWMVFSATLLVSGVVYLLTLYKGGSFGGTAAYIEAFGAGFGGQVLVGVVSIPLAQSLFRVASAK